LATTIEAAVRELIGPEQAKLGWVPASALADRVVTPLALPADVRAANVSSNKATKFGVTGELCTTSRYGITQIWARSFAGAGFDAVWHRLRFTPGKGRGVALFGPSGAPDPAWSTAGHVQPVRPVIDKLGCPVVHVPATSSLVVNP